jgi:hypothetical protein
MAKACGGKGLPSEWNFSPGRVLVEVKGAFFAKEEQAKEPEEKAVDLKMLVSIPRSGLKKA